MTDDLSNYYKDLEHICIDQHRQKRCHAPETIYCAHKSVEDILSIAEHFEAEEKLFFATRVSDEAAAALLKEHPHAQHNAIARTVIISREEVEQRGLVAVVSAGSSDRPVFEEAAVTAEITGSRVVRITDCGVAGLHRVLGKIETIRAANAVIVVAGMDGALPSVIGGLVDIPVIAVPTSVGYGSCFEGLAPLLTMLNSCAAGVSVVNIDNGFGAGYQASIINTKVVNAQLNSQK